MTTEIYDVIIVGGGPAGATVAKYLAKAEKKVLLLQKDLSFKKPCGGGIRADTFSEFEISSDSIVKKVTEIVLETKSKKTTFDISASPLAIVDRVRFDKELRNAAKDAGAEIIEGKVTGVDILDAGVRVSANIGEESQTYEAEYLIAADGVYSFVRKTIHKEEVPKTLVHYADIDTMVTDKCHFYFGSALAGRAYAWRFPYVQGSDVGTLSSRHNKKHIHALFSFLKVRTEEKIKGYCIPEWEDPVFYDRRVFYVGDAAGQVLPFTYEGIYYAMKSAKILSEVIIEDMHPSEYEKRWNRFYLKKFTLLKRLQSLFLRNDLAIHIMMKTLEKPSVKQKVLTLWMGEYALKINAGFLWRVTRQLFR